MAPGTRGAGKRPAERGAREHVGPAVAEPETVRRRPLVLMFSPLSGLGPTSLGRERALSRVRRWASTFAAGSVPVRVGKAAARESRRPTPCDTHPLPCPDARSQAKYDEALAKGGPFLRLCLERLPVDEFVGVKKHGLNALWAHYVDGSGEKGLSKWLSSNTGKACFSDGHLGLHSVKDKRVDGVKDTWLVFAGPSETLLPTQRGLKFKVLEDARVLAADTEPAEQRIARLINRANAPKRIDTGISPLKAADGIAGGAAASAGDGSDASSSDNDDDEQLEAVSIVPDDESDGERAPWEHLSRRDMYNMMVKAQTLAGAAKLDAVEARRTAAAKATAAAEKAAQAEYAKYNKYAEKLKAEYNEHAEKLRAEHVKEVAAVVAELDEAVSTRDAALDENRRLRLREDQLMRRLQTSTTWAQQCLAEVQNYRRGIVAQRVRELEALLERRREEVAGLGAELRKARSETLPPLEEEASSAMLQVRNRVRRKRGGRERVVTYVRALDLLDLGLE